MGTWAGGGEGESGKWMAATFNFVPPAGYTFGVLAFLRSLRVWGPGLGEEREGVGSGWPQLYVLFPPRGILSEFSHF